MLRHLSNTVRLTDFVNIVTFNEDTQGKLAAQVLLNETPIREQVISFLQKRFESLVCKQPHGLGSQSTFVGLTGKT